MSVRLLAAMLLASAWLTGCQGYRYPPAHDGGGAAHGGGSGRVADEPWVNVRFADEERRIITAYCQENVRPAKPLPPGLQKKVARGGSLPPGWQKKMAVGQTVPDDVYRECRPLPPDVVVKLPPQPRDTAIIIIEGKVVRLARATREILDVFDVPY